MIADGPGDFYSTERPPSPGQLERIVREACELLGLDVPETRLDATKVIVRLGMAKEEIRGEAPVAVPDF